MADIYYIIPAKKTSERFPEKNRKLLEYTLDQVYSFDNVIVCTDDEYMENHCLNRGVRVCDHPHFFYPEEETTKEVITNFINTYRIKPDDIICVLYLTYPQRTKEDIDKFIKHFIDNEYRSMLCRKELSGPHPYLFLYDHFDGTGSQIDEHDLCRSQDYPAVFEISHFIFACRANQVRSLNNNLYNDMTVFYPIDNKVDIDYPENLESCGL